MNRFPFFLSDVLFFFGDGRGGTRKCSGPPGPILMDVQKPQCAENTSTMSSSCSNSKLGLALKRNAFCSSFYFYYLFFFILLVLRSEEEASKRLPRQKHFVARKHGQLIYGGAVAEARTSTRGVEAGEAGTWDGVSGMHADERGGGKIHTHLLKWCQIFLTDFLYIYLFFHSGMWVNQMLT